jgi:signal transduction histidine kinase
VIAFARSMGGRVFFYLAFGTIAAFALANDLASWHINHPFTIVAFLVAIFVLSFLVARIATAPLAHLASAADRLQNDIESAPMKEDGPTEVRRAASAFNAMQARIARDVRERTSMLAAITHDLQTPVTRLRLRIEKVADEPLRAKLVADLDAMRATIREGLDLATSLDARETPQPIDLDSMLESVVADACETGHDATLQGRTQCFVLGSPNAVRRCLTNLLDNAIAYGGYARVECASDASRAVVYVRDGGPGIPEDQLEQVFEPFVRVEHSRSRETGGTGIGLTIARNIVTRMGGTIALRNHPDGGLEIRLELPRGGSVRHGTRPA